MVLADRLNGPFGMGSARSLLIGMTQKCFPQPLVGQVVAVMPPHTLETGEIAVVRSSIYASDSVLQTKHWRRRN
jgi:hypothetical protein